jgi:hypothetical protein
MSDWQPIDFFRPVLMHPVGGDLPSIVVPLLTIQLPEVALAVVLPPASRGAGIVAAGLAALVRDVGVTDELSSSRCGFTPMQSPSPTSAVSNLDGQPFIRKVDTTFAEFSIAAEGVTPTSAAIWPAAWLVGRYTACG